MYTTDQLRKFAAEDCFFLQDDVPDTGYLSWEKVLRALGGTKEEPSETAIRFRDNALSYLD